ncbi:arrestin homolog [Portunus trituberculatus]|uniref:arrestin homolog n=1 Tax=Portunus trituberculatus TaxID=210409 RepID=UPI001E1CB9DE|nr:arrestin homolog [Portunus trituberculatus]
MVSSVRVFKKTSANGKVTAYLSRRDFVDHISHTSPVDGVVVVDKEYLKDRKVFARVTVTYRYGREEDEVIGQHFSKELELVKSEVVAAKQEVSDVVECVMSKLGDDARPFCIQLPAHAPASVTLDPEHESSSRKLGVTYELALYVAEHPEESPLRRAAVIFPVRKVQFSPAKSLAQPPVACVTRTFTLPTGKITLELQLQQDLCFHGQPMEAQVKIDNTAKKTVKSLGMQVVQHVEVTMTNTSFSSVVASIETYEGCPVIPNSRFSKTIVLTPLPLRAHGVALEGNSQDEDASLASSTMMSAAAALSDILGIIVSYALRVKLNCGSLGGDLSIELPFKLMHGESTTTKALLQRSQSAVDYNLVIEEYSAMRRGKSLTDELEE